MMKNKIVVLGTFWNESEWIDRSLLQIEKISPDLAVLCDGCFDSKKPNYSTDGTKQKLENFCKDEGRLKFEAVRQSRLKSTLEFLKYGFVGKFSFLYIFWILRHAVFTNSYRLNQAITFLRMLKIAKSKFGDEKFWFLTLDADQFYSDHIIELLKNKLLDFDSDVFLLTAKEKTFVDNFYSYTSEYEKRTWNNMPHKHCSMTKILPTRDFMIVNTFSAKLYYYARRSISGGVYFHYKFRLNKKRLSDGYDLGDRKAPDENRFKNSVKFEGLHPDVIRRDLDGY